MSVRKPMMAGNWKMHHTHLEAIQVVQKLGFRLESKDYDRVDVVVIPAFTALRSVQTTIDGDSERRELFGDTNEVVAKKLRAVLAAGMTPILCVGETLEERENGTTEAKVKGQIEAAFDRLPADDIARCIVAYEPIWAIGTGRNATPDDAN